jgi:hypothetical protein
MESPFGENCHYTEGTGFNSMAGVFSAIARDLVVAGWQIQNPAQDINNITFPIAIQAPTLSDGLVTTAPDWVILLDPNYELEFINVVKDNSAGGAGTDILEIIPEYGRIIFGTPSTIINDVCMPQVPNSGVVTLPDLMYDVNVPAYKMNNIQDTGGSGVTSQVYRENETMYPAVVGSRYNNVRFSNDKLLKYTPGEVYPILSGAELTDTVFVLSYQLSVTNYGLAICVESDKSPFGIPGRVIVAQRLTDCRTGSIVLNRTDPVFCLFTGLNRLYKTTVAEEFVIHNPTVPRRYIEEGFNSLYQIVIRENTKAAPSKPVNITRYSEYKAAPAINLLKQISFSEENDIYLSFPLGLSTETHMYGTEWMDMLGTTSAGVAGQKSWLDISMYRMLDETLKINRYIGTISSYGGIEGFRYWFIKSSKRSVHTASALPTYSFTFPKNELFIYDLELPTEDSVRYLSTDIPKGSEQFSLNLHGRLMFKSMYNFVGSCFALYSKISGANEQGINGRINFNVVDTFDLKLTITRKLAGIDTPIVELPVRISVKLTKLYSYSVVTDSMGVINLKGIPLGTLCIDAPSKPLIYYSGANIGNVSHRVAVSTTDLLSISLDLTAS